MNPEREQLLQKRALWLDASSKTSSTSPATVNAGEGQDAPEVVPQQVPQTVELSGEAIHLLKDIKDALERLITVNTPVAAAPPQVSNAALPVPVGGPVVPPAPRAPSYDMFDFGAGNEDYVDPRYKCGICMGHCNALLVLVKCGHYPYCPECVHTLEVAKQDIPMWERSDDFDSYKLLCPTCQTKVPEFFKLNDREI